jgi:hypothetical protein
MFENDVHNLECIHGQSEDFYTKNSLKEMRSLVLISGHRSNGKKASKHQLWYYVCSDDNVVSIENSI